MKTFTLTSILALFLTLMIGLAFGVEYGKDFLEPGNPGGWSASLKTFDEELTVSCGDTFDVDIWINDTPEKLLAAGFIINYDASQIRIVGVDAYDGALPGPWDEQMTNKVPNPSGLPGSYMLVVGNLATVLPDGGGDIPVARITFECVALVNVEVTCRPVEGFDTVVGNSSKVYDSEIAPNTLIISLTTTTSTAASTVTPTTTCPPGVICINCPSELIYGEYAEQTEVLRHFRDNVLSKTPEGRELIKLYHQWSRIIVRSMEQDEEFKEDVREMIDSVLPMIEREVQ